MWGRRKGVHLKKKTLPILDQFWLHLKECIKQKFQQCNTELAVILGQVTLQLKPLNIYLNKPFKVYLDDGCQRSSADAKGCALKYSTITHTWDWVKASWSKVNEQTVVKSFLKCGITNALDECEDHVLCKDENDEEQGKDVSGDSDKRRFR